MKSTTRKIRFTGEIQREFFILSLGPKQTLQGCNEQRAYLNDALVLKRFLVRNETEDFAALSSCCKCDTGNDLRVRTEILILSFFRIFFKPGIIGGTRGETVIDMGCGLDYPSSKPE